MILLIICQWEVQSGGILYRYVSTLDFSKALSPWHIKLRLFYRLHGMKGHLKSAMKSLLLLAVRQCMCLLEHAWESVLLCHYIIILVLCPSWYTDQTIVLVQKSKESFSNTRKALFIVYCFQRDTKPGLNYLAVQNRFSFSIVHVWMLVFQPHLLQLVKSVDRRCVT